MAPQLRWLKYREQKGSAWHKTPLRSHPLDMVSQPLSFGQTRDQVARPASERQTLGFSQSGSLPTSTIGHSSKNPETEIQVFSKMFTTTRSGKRLDTSPAVVPPIPATRYHGHLPPGLLPPQWPRPGPAFVMDHSPADPSLKLTPPTGVVCIGHPTP